VRVRTLSAVVVAVLAVAGLAGCRTNVGTAATVGGHRITESDVNGYITPTGVSSSAAAQARSQRQAVPSPRSLVLQFLIQQQLFEQTLKHLGIAYSEGSLAGSHDKAAQLLLQTSLGGAALDAAIEKQLPSSGVQKSFRAVFLRVEELEYLLIQRRQLSQLSELVALVKAAKVSVSVSARYGTWQPNKLILDGTPAVPSYLTVQNAAAGQPAS
jgi:hypothetical protein